jgi:Bacterial extracellular solute-binding protein
MNVITLPANWANWANYGNIMKDFTAKYGIKINDANPDGSSQDEINAMQQLKGQSRAPDVLDIGTSFAIKADQAGLLAPYKVATWTAIPANTKASDSTWYDDYGSYVAIGYDSAKVKVPPTSFKDLLKPIYKNQVAINGNPTQAKVRLQLREQIRSLQQRLGTTTLFVTHDQEEALSMADRVGVMHDGRLEQIATPDELYDRPATPFVAEFVGIMNRIPAALSATRWTSAWPGRRSWSPNGKTRPPACGPLVADGADAGQREQVGDRVQHVLGLGRLEFVAGRPAGEHASHQPRPGAAAGLDVARRVADHRELAHRPPAQPQQRGERQVGPGAAAPRVSRGQGEVDQGLPAEPVDDRVPGRRGKPGEQAHLDAGVTQRGDRPGGPG